MKKRKLHLTGRCGGFTLAELIIALSVMSIILAAAATLAFAVSTAEAATSKMGQRQAHLRFSSMRIRELARNSCSVFTYSTTGVIFWKDDLNADGKINGNEVAWLYVDRVGREYTVNLTEFPDYSDSLTMGQLQYDNGLMKMRMTDEKTTVLLTECLSASISLVMQKLVIVDFSLSAEGQSRKYQMSGGIRASAVFLNKTKALNVQVTQDDDL